MSSLALVGSRDLDERLGQQVDGSSLAFVRIAFALQLLIDLAILAWDRDIEGRYINPVVYFKYPFFPIIPQMPGLVAYGVFTLIGLLGLAVLCGWRTSWTAPGLALLYIYVFLVDATAYSDHSYLLCLLAILCAWLPVNRWLSSDLYTNRLKTTTVPAWTIGFFRIQVSLIILFIGVARLNSDWLAGVPISERIALYGYPQPLVQFLKQSPQYFPMLAWALALGPILISLLLWVRPALWVVLPVWWIYCFAGKFWFQVDSSPILNALLTVAFLPPDLPRRVGKVLGGILAKLPGALLLWKLLCTLGKVIDGIAAWFDEAPGKKKIPVAVGSTETRSPRLVSEWTRYAVVIWILIQIAIPLRWVAFSRTKDWADYTSRFSWRGELQDKQGRVNLAMVLEKQQLRWQIEPTGEFPIPLACIYSSEDLQKKNLNEGRLRDLVRATVEARPGLQGNLTQQDLDFLFAAHNAFQQAQISTGHQEIMLRSPEFVRQYAREVAGIVGGVTGDEVSMYANLEISVNYRPFKVCLPNNVNLSEVESASDLWPAILPLNESLPNRETRLATAEATKAQQEMEIELELRTLGLKRPPEPQKAPGLTAEDEEFLQAYFPDNAKP